MISGEKSDHKAIGTNGVGIKSITIDATNSDEIKTTYIIEFDKGEPFSFVVKNGLDGKDMVSEKISITFNYMPPGPQEGSGPG